MSKINQLDLDQEDVNYFENEIKRSISESVTPGFKVLRDFMIRTQKYANKNHGIWSQPGGDEYY